MTYRISYKFEKHLSHPKSDNGNADQHMNLSSIMHKLKAKNKYSRLGLTFDELYRKNQEDVIVRVYGSVMADCEYDSHDFCDQINVKDSMIEDAKRFEEFIEEFAKLTNCTEAKKDWWL